jgi:hypothetical protein
MHSVPLLVILSKKSNLFPEKAQDNILSEKMPVYWGENQISVETGWGF